ncbi:MAG TPA: hypothetical protein VF207_01075 [Chthoniobacterales bacterium]
MRLGTVFFSPKRSQDHEVMQGRSFHTLSDQSSKPSGWINDSSLPNDNFIAHDLQFSRHFVESVGGGNETEPRILQASKKNERFGELGGISYWVSAEPQA